MNLQLGILNIHVGTFGTTLGHTLCRAKKIEGVTNSYFNEREPLYILLLLRLLWQRAFIA